jgi:hypothetical protein
MNRIALSLHTLLVLLGIYFLITIQLEGFANDPGVGWHLKTGEWITEQKQIPREDPFLSLSASKRLDTDIASNTTTRSVQKRRWIADQWLGDYLFFQGYQAGGFPILYLSGVIFFTLYFFGFLFHALRCEGSSIIAASLAAALAFKASQIHCILRPVLLGIGLFLLTTIWLRTLLRDSQYVSSQLCRCITGTALFFLWANIHPSFPLGLVLLTLFVGHRFFEGAETFTERAQRLRSDLFLFLCCLGATCFNPYGISLHASILTLGHSDYFMYLHEEWLPLSFSDPEGRFFLCLIVLGIIGITLAMRRDGIKSQAFLLTTCLLFSLLTLRSVRMLPYASILLSFPSARGLSLLFEYLSVSTRAPWQRLFEVLAFKRHSHLSREHGALILWFLFIVGYYGAHARLPLMPSSFPYGPDQDLYPIQEVVTLREEAKHSGNPIVLAAHPNYGGIITFFGYPEVKAIIDDRNTLIGETFHRATLEALTSSTPADFFRTQGATHLLLEEPQDPTQSQKRSFHIIPLK